MQGICFIEPLFHKVVKETKSKTRRIIPIQPLDDRDWVIGTLMDSTLKEDSKGIGKNHYMLPPNIYHNLNDRDKRYFTPKYKVGEIVYMKEPYILFQETYSELKQTESGLTIAYKYGNTNTLEEITGDTEAKWRNKLFMPEYAARYFIVITGVRAERLQDISEEDCLKEGIGYAPIQKLSWSEKLTPMWSNGFNRYSTPQKAYAALIDKINGKGTWERNPFVCAYDFKSVKPFQI